MKRLVCVAIGVLSVAGATAPALAQSASSERRVEVGLKAGLSTAKLEVTGLPGFEPEAGLGALGGLWLSAGRDDLRVQAELTFGSRRFSSASPIGDIDVASRVADVPVLVVGRWRPGARVRPLLFGGGFIGLVSHVTQTIGSTETGLDDEVKGVDAGAAFGGALEIAARRGALVIDARYLLGVRDLSESDATTFKSRAFVFSVGYRF